MTIKHAIDLDFMGPTGAGGFRVKLSDWRKSQGYNQQQLADALDVSQPTISYIERANDPQVPSPGLMRKIWTVTKGAVAPNDFYDLPSIDQLELPVGSDSDAPLLLSNAAQQ